MLPFLALIPLLFACRSHPSQPTVKTLNLKKYMGTWYEIARFDHSFERGLAGVTATYSLREDGKIKVINEGYKGGLNGKKSQAVGKAKQPNPDDPGKLKVSFFAFFYADYWVLDLDTKHYTYAMIGSPSKKYLWILSRSPQLDPAIDQALRTKAAELGYEVDRLIEVEQALKAE